MENKLRRIGNKGAAPSGNAWMLLILLGMAAVVVGLIGFAAIGEGGVLVPPADDDVEGFPVDTVKMTVKNTYTENTESSDDIELWKTGADTSDPDLDPLTTVDLSTGTANDTSLMFLSTDNQATKDLYFEGTGNYYDEKVPAWHLAYNKDTGNGVIMFNGDAWFGVTDVGTFKDLDTADALDTGLADGGTDQIDYNTTTGDGTVYARYEIGNDEVDAELRQIVIAICDDDGDLEGDELDGFTITQYSGTALSGVAGDYKDTFIKAAGSGGCQVKQLGTWEGFKTGIYKIDFQINEANFNVSGEEFEICFDDLGDIGTRQYPSSNLKATKECLTVNSIGD